MAHITYYGHSCFMVEIGGQKLLFDPFITGNDAASDIDISTIHPDFILLSHGHQDHILDAETIAKQSGAPIVANFEIVTWYGDKGIENGVPMNHGGEIILSGKVAVKMVNAVHTSSFPDGSYAGQPSGFVVRGFGSSFYYSGDTALHYDMKLISEDEHEPIDFAFLCLGDHFTMGVKDSIRAAQFVGTQKVIGMHFDTFPPIELHHAKAEKAYSDAEVSLKLPKIGEEFEV